MTAPALIDSHVNLHHERFGEDLEDVLVRARAAGVAGMVTICDKLASIEAIAAIADSRRALWRTVGVHPHYAADHQDLTAERLIALAAPEKVVGIGECGLDFHYEFSDRVSQEKVFAAHIEAAQETGLPLVIHTREADAEMGRLLAVAHGRKAFTPLLHCYTGGPELARDVVAMGGYVSFSGILTFRNADDIRRVAAAAPEDRVIVETDCPYLAPVPHRGRRCEPAHVREVAHKLAEVRGISFERMAEITTENFFRLFARARREEISS